MNPSDESSEAGERREIVFPCLLWEPTLDTVVLATEQGVATVLRAGRSSVLKIGMIVPYAASRWCIRGEEWDFILPPRELRITLRNASGPGSRPIRLGVDADFDFDEQ